MSDSAGVTVEGGLDEKPEVLLPAGDPPPELVIHDVIEGEGDPVEPAGRPSASSTPPGTGARRCSSPSGASSPAGRRGSRA